VEVENGGGGIRWRWDTVEVEVENGGGWWSQGGRVKIYYKEENYLDRDCGPLNI